MLDTLILLSDRLDKIGKIQIANSIDKLIKVAAETIKTEDDFITAIHNDPNNSNLRSVYADWLEEQSRIDEAEYVRLENLVDRIKQLKDKVPSKLLCSLATRTIEVRCPQCEAPAELRIFSNRAIWGVRCANNDNNNNHVFFPFHPEIGNRYKFKYNTFMYYGGVDGKWFEEC